MICLSCGDMPEDTFTSLSQLTVLHEWSLGPFLLMFPLRDGWSLAVQNFG